MIPILKKDMTGFKVYSLLIEGQSYTFLSIQLAKSLEEAFVLARSEFTAKNIKTQNQELMVGAKISLFEIKEISELFLGTDFSNQKVNSLDQEKQKIEKNVSNLVQPKKKQDDLSEKNKLIKFIIDGNSKEIFEKNKNLFTQNEIEYIQDKIKKI